MAVPVHRRLISATATVVGFWTLVALGVSFFFFSHTFSDNLPFLLDRILWVLACIFAAIALLLFWEAAEVFAVTLGLRPQSRRGLSTTTIGMLPRSSGITAPQSPIPHKKRAAQLDAAIARFQRDKAETQLDKPALRQFALQHNNPRTELFWAIYGILEESGLPASPYHGSHGDASLLEHSLRVAAAMARGWAEMDQAGIEAVRAGGKASSKSFDRETAILAGMAHDIGKVLCFRRDGENIEVVGLHDIEGSRLLARLDAFWELMDSHGQHDNFLQRMLTQSICFYHHAYAYPGSGYKRNFIQTDEAVVDLMQAIRKADLVAGQIEGRADEVANDYQDSNDLPERKMEEQIWESFLYLLSHTNLINHKSPEQRIGYKQGNLVFLAEKRIRAQICAHLGLTRADYVADNNGNPGPIIKIISAKLDEQGILKKDYGYPETKSCKKPEGAGFYLTIEGTTKDGEASEVEEKIPYYLVRIDGSDLFSRFAELEDYRAKLGVASPTWPQYFKKPEESSEAEETGSQKQDTSAQDADSEPAESPETTQVEPSTEQDQEQQRTPDQRTEDQDDADDADPFAGETQPDTASQDDSDDLPPDEGESLWGCTPVESPAFPRTEDTDPSPVEPSQEPVTEPETRPAAPATLDADSRERRLQEIQAARRKAEQQHSHNRMINPIMQTPEQRVATVRQRVRDLLNTYPQILPEIPDKKRKRLLFSMVWLDEIQRDARLAEGSGQQQYRGYVQPLLDLDPPGEAKTLVTETLSALAPGSYLLMEVRMILKIVTDLEGKVDMQSSNFIAPAESSEDADAL
ncbi:metal-dependent phosphohydrolase [Acidithiobacillus sp. HP-6]|uniref:HD domain-containing protein n=1 Tax=unclassified Acidithiobacillus TaxID=2614800 RepID=UPI001879FD64|nr:MULTISPECIES: HD domain-containing protein [unclassified Acidithiobacillus]MBE7562701.1 metal-dependent phosphohydrolase [Acidithiobacillus sp. HP-6]MBE7570503.1 metal-dependent phosphohydrolase [Acidithiobacillus sp. HP-2]